MAWTFFSKRCSSAGTLCNAKTGATTFLSSQSQSAGRSQWLGHSCPSEWRGRRDQNGCDDIPVVAEPASRTLPVARTFLSKRMAGTPTPKRVRRHSCRRRTSQQDAPSGLDIPVQANGGDVLQRQNGCDDIPVVASFLGGDSGIATPKRVRRHSCRRGFSWRGRFATPRKASHPQRVAWTFLSKRRRLCSTDKNVRATLVAWTVSSKHGSSAARRGSTLRKPYQPFTPAATFASALASVLGAS